MKTVFLLFILILNFTLCSQYYKVNEAWKLFEKGQINNAEILMKEIGEKHLVKFSKIQKTFFYINYGKIQIGQKKYAEALNNLLKSKQLNVNDSLQYQRIYNSAFGELFQSIGAYSTAIDYKKKVYTQTNDYFSKFLAANSIGSMFYKLNQIDSALYYFSLQIESSHNIENKIYFASSKNNIGLAYMQKQQYNKALTNFQEAQKYILNKNLDLDFYYSLQENIGLCLFELKEYKNALKRLILVHNNDLKTKKYLNSSFYQNLIVSTYLKLKEIEKAKKIEKDIQLDYFKMNTISKYNFLSLQHEIALGEKKFTKANQIFDKIKTIQIINEREKKEALNSSNVIVAKYLIYEAKTRIAVEQKQKRNSQKALELQKKENYFMRILSISVFLLLLIGLFVLYQNLKNKQKKALLEREFLKLEEEKLKLKIGEQEKNLTEFAIDFSNKKELNKEIISQLNYLSSLQETEIKPEIKSIISQLKTRQNLDKRVEDLNKNSDLILLQFKNKMIQLHPKLNKNEIELCSLIKLNLSNKEIANFRNISDDSVKIIKNRLKKKLNIDSSIVLGEYLAGIN